MNLKKLLIPAVILLIPLIFFYKTVLFQKVPFPGDLLLANYEPYRSITVGIPSKDQGADVIRELYPWKYYSVSLLKQGIFPLWDPYVFSGNPHFANLQSGTLYPVNFLFFIMPFVTAWSIYIILQYLFVLVFTYLYLRVLKLSKIPSLFGAVTFSFCAFLTVWGEYGNVGHSLSFLPIILYSIEKILGSKRFRWYAILIFSFVFSIFAGYIQLTLYMYILCAVYIAAKFFTSKEKNNKAYLFLCIAFLFGILVAAVQLIPLYEFVRLSLRAPYSYKELQIRLLPLESIITLLVPDFFGNPATRNYFLQGGSTLERASNIGVWPLIFAVFAVFTKKTFHKVFFGVVALITLLSCLSIPPIAYFQSVGIPFLSTGIPTRILSIFSFAMAVLAALGLDSFLHHTEKRKIILTLSFFAVFFLILWSVTFLIHNPELLISRHNLILSTAIFVIGFLLIISKAQKKISITIILVLTIFELFYSFQKFNSFVPANYVYPKTQIEDVLHKIQGIDRYFGYGSGNIDANFQIYEKNYTTEGYDPLFNRQYGEFTAASATGNLPMAVPRSVANILHGYGVNDLKQNFSRQRALNLAGVKYVLNRTDTKGLDSAFSEINYKLIWDANGWQIYQNKQVLPRITLFGNYAVYSNPENSLRLLYNPKFDYRNVLVLSQPVFPGYNILPDPKSTVKTILYSANSIKVITSSSQDQLLFVSDNFFPGWRAKVDGEKVQILSANYTFRAVPLKKGRHTVEMYYAPLSFWAGLWVSIFSVLSLLVFFLYTKMKNRW